MLARSVSRYGVNCLSIRWWIEVHLRGSKVGMLSQRAVKDCDDGNNLDSNEIDSSVKWQ